MSAAAREHELEPEQRDFEGEQRKSFIATEAGRYMEALLRSGTTMREEEMVERVWRLAGLMYERRRK